MSSYTPNDDDFDDPVPVMATKTNQVRVRKGEEINLTRLDPTLREITVGVGWDLKRFEGDPVDVDASLFLLDKNDKTREDEDFVFYNNPTGRQGAVRHMGDNLTGEGEGDDEQIKVDLAQIPAAVQKVDFTVTIYDAETRKQNFGQVSNAYIRVLDETNNKELIRYDLGEDFSVETAVVVAEIYRHGTEWKFNAIGSGFQGGLGALCKNFGVNV